MLAMIVAIKYKYRFYKYLAADEKGNIYLLPHFCERRTVNFNKLKPFLNGNKKSIKYKGSNISFSQLKRCAYEVDEILFNGKPC